MTNKILVLGLVIDCQWILCIYNMVKIYNENQVYKNDRRLD